MEDNQADTCNDNYIELVNKFMQQMECYIENIVA
ncbi:hypothetical protein N480_06410 [Pseudoalteromonas luteoviolacea S2607]|nr:hypothetical protein N480_06410 [Pseudoalteromonas luteoviolacea S2607]